MMRLSELSCRLLSAVVAVIAAGACDSMKPSKTTKTVAPDVDPASGDTGGGSLTVEQQAAIWEETVYQLVNGAGNRCSSCHGSVTAPFFAADNSLDGYKAALENKKFNLTAPETSRMVLRLRNESHNCWSECAANADEMEAAIRSLSEQITAGGGAAGDGDTTERIKTSLQSATFEPHTPHTVLLEAEDGEINNRQGNPIVTDAGASGEAYVSLDNDFNRSIFLKLTVPRPGMYHFIFRFMNPADNPRDYNVAVDGPGLPFVDISGLAAEATGEEWKWIPARYSGEQTDIAPLFLQAGDYQLVVRGNNELRFDQLAVTDDPKFEGIGFSQQMPAQVLSYNLTSVIKAKFPDFKGEVSFSVDLERTPEGSYRFRSPRMLSTKVGMKIAGARFLYAGVYQDQYRTFEDVDAEVKAGQFAVLHAAPLNVLIDADPSDDQFSFEFDTLEPIAAE